MPPTGSRGHVYAIVLTRIINAGLFEIACDLSHRLPCRQRVRLPGVVLPKDRAAAAAAAAWVEAWVATHTRTRPPGLFMTLDEGRDRRHGPYVTYPARLTAPDGCALDISLVTAGIAHWRNPHIKGEAWPQ